MNIVLEMEIWIVNDEYFITQGLNGYEVYDCGDNPKEVERRMKADIKDFNGAEMLADRIVYNNQSDDIEDVISNVDYWYRKILKEKADE